jgi:hypothetical protein
MTRTASMVRSPRLGVFHCTFTGAAVLGVIFLLAWVTEAVADVEASNALLTLFTQQALRSPAAISEGLVSAILLGALLGALVAIFFNLIGAFMRR